MSIRKVVLQIIILAVVAFSFALHGNALAIGETRGVRVMAKEVASGEQKELKLYNKSYAVIIGIDQYPNLPFDRQLNYAVRDAKGVEQVIRKNYKFDRIITLYNKDATKDSIMKVLLGDLAAEMTEEDSLFIFWAGHGNQEKTREGELGYLIPYDGSISEIYKNITMSDIRDTISKKIPAKHIFYVMDACYGGLLAQTRSVDRQTKRDFAYLQEVTKERVRQVLTAGGKDEEVLDGGAKGHSVFTGRLIEALENSEDFITANELQTIVKEKVFSDARARSHKQTPSYGPLYGVGDYVFVPSIEQKAEDTQEKIAALQREIEKLNTTEVAAGKAQDERAKRQVEIEKRAVEAKLKAEQLKQQTLEEEKKKREIAEHDRKKEEAELVQKKKADDERLAVLKRDVEEKRKGMGGTTLSSLSPEKTFTEMNQIDRKIKTIKEQYRNELKNGIKQIVDRMNVKYLKLADAKKDEFETEDEFKKRVAKEQEALNKDQTGEFTVFQDRLENEYVQQIDPFIEELKKLSANEFLIPSERLSIELGTYDGISNTYPITIRMKNPIKTMLAETQDTNESGVVAANSVIPACPESFFSEGFPTRFTCGNDMRRFQPILLAANGDVPLPKHDAAELRKHYELAVNETNAPAFATPSYLKSGKGELIEGTGDKILLLAANNKVKILTVVGEVIAVNSRANTITVRGKKDDVALTSVNSEVRVGDMVKVQYSEIGGKNVVKKIYVSGTKREAVPSAKADNNKTAAPDATPATKTKQPEEKYVLLAATASVPIPREEAREFKKHFDNNMLRAEVKGNFFTPDTFMIAQAYVIDDATTKQYSLFTAQFVDMGNGTLYDTKTKLIWDKNGNAEGRDISWYQTQSYITRLNQQGYKGFKDWRMPTLEEMQALVSYAKSEGFGSGHNTVADFLNNKGFQNVSKLWYYTSSMKSSSDAWRVHLEDGREHGDGLDYSSNKRVLVVRSGR